MEVTEACCCSFMPEATTKRKLENIRLNTAKYSLKSFSKYVYFLNEMTGRRQGEISGVNPSL